MVYAKGPQPQGKGPMPVTVDHLVLGHKERIKSIFFPVCGLYGLYLWGLCISTKAFTSKVIGIY